MESATNPCSAESTEQEYRALVARIASADEQALADFYDATVARVYGLALRITGATWTAEEVVSDVYMQVWQQAERYDAERGKVLAWLLTLCRSRALDLLRRRDPAQTNVDLSDGDALTQYDSSPVDLLQGLQQDSEICAAVATLSDVQRQLISLAFYRGLSHSELAIHTGLPLGTVKSNLRRAMQKLKSILEAASTYVETST